MTTELTASRRRVALFALALGSFALGISEFATMGLLSEIARDLLPAFDADPAGSIARSGTLISAYALGVFIGAPTLSVLGARFPQNRLVIWLLAALLVGNLATALLSGFETTVVTRFLAGVPHGAYLGVASLLAGHLLGPGSQGRGVALALSGLTVANVVGVPLSTWGGQLIGWRWAYVAVAVIFVLTIALLLVTLPHVPGDRDRHPLAELRAFTRLRFWLVIGIGAIGFGGFFAVFTYIAEVAVQVAGLDAAAVPFVLLAIGLGMVAGNAIGGWAADRSIRRTSVLGILALIVALVLYTVLAQLPFGIYLGVFLVGVGAWTFTPAVQSWLINVSGEQRLIGAAMNHASFNAANSLGAWLGGAVIAAGFGYLAPAWVGVALAAAGLGLVALVITLENRAARGAGAEGERETLGAGAGPRGDERGAPRP